MWHHRKSCYCAFCKVERKVYVNRHLSLLDVMGLVLFGITCTFAVYKTIDPRGLFFVGTFLLLGEIFSQMKWRSSMVCRNCGFDPVVYVRSPEQAGLKIKAFLEKRALSPEYLLRPPVVMKANKEKTPKGQNLSLKI